MPHPVHQHNAVSSFCLDSAVPADVLRQMQEYKGGRIRRIMANLNLTGLIANPRQVRIAALPECDRQTFLAIANKALLRAGPSRSNPQRQYLLKRYSAYKKNAASRSIPFNISRQELSQLFYRSDGECSVTGIPFSLDMFGARRAPFAPSIDRIDSRNGYEKKNVRLVCQIVNLAMNVWGDKVLREFLHRAAGAHHERQQPDFSA